MLVTEYIMFYFRYDPDASGTINGEKFLNKLGINFSQFETNGADTSRLSPIPETGKNHILL